MDLGCVNIVILYGNIVLILLILMSTILISLLIKSSARVVLVA